MTATSTVTSKNQTTLPKAVMEALGIKPADQILYEIHGDFVTLRPHSGRLVELARIEPFGPTPNRPHTLEEIRETIAVAAAEAARKRTSRRRR